MSTNDPEYMKRYQQERRAKRKTGTPPFPEKPEPTGRGKVEETKGYHYLPGDEWVGSLTQAQRDFILNQPSMVTPKRSRND